VIVDRCAVRFIPRENGLHWVHVRQNSRPIPGSPFRCVVGSHHGDVALVTARGQGLTTGHVGQSSLSVSYFVCLSVCLICSVPLALCLTDTEKSLHCGRTCTSSIQLYVGIRHRRIIYYTVRSSQSQIPIK